jgi:hypothetical protein
MIREYTHDLKREIFSISGRYELEREEKIEYQGRDILYVIGNAVVDSSCCGYWGCRYAVVPGFVVGWKSGTNGEGLPISQVDPIMDEKLRKEIRRFIQEKECVSQVEFW